MILKCLKAIDDINNDPFLRRNFPPEREPGLKISEPRKPESKYDLRDELKADPGVAREDLAKGPPSPASNQGLSISCFLE